MKVDRKPLAEHWSDLKKFKKQGKVSKAEYEERIGEIVLEEFLEIWEARGRVERTSLGEALGLFIAVMWKNNYTTWLENSPYMLRLFYDEIAVGAYQDRLKSDLDKATMKYLVEESEDERKTSQTSIGRGFPNLVDTITTMILNKVTTLRSGDSDDLIPHYLFVRLIEQALDYAKSWLEKELKKEKPFFCSQKDVVLSRRKDEAKLESERTLREESARLVIERIESLFEKEQVPYWEKHQEEYLNIWPEEKRSEIHVWKRDFNIFKKYHLGEELDEDIEITYQTLLIATIYSKENIKGESTSYTRGDKEVLPKGTVIDSVVLRKLINHNTGNSHENPDKEVMDLFKYPSGSVIGFPDHKLGYVANFIENMISYCSNLALEEMAINHYGIKYEEDAIESNIFTSVVIEYLRLVREDSKLNRIRELSMGERGDEQGRPIGGSSLSINLTVNNIVGGQYLSELYNGVMRMVTGRKEVKSSEQSKVLIEELVDENSPQISSGENLPSYSDDEGQVGSDVDEGKAEVGPDVDKGNGLRGWLGSFHWFASAREESAERQEEGNYSNDNRGNRTSEQESSFLKSPGEPPPSEKENKSNQKIESALKILPKQLMENWKSPILLPIIRELFRTASLLYLWKKSCKNGMTEPTRLVNRGMLVGGVMLCLLIVLVYYGNKRSWLEKIGSNSNEKMNALIEAPKAIYNIFQDLLHAASYKGKRGEFRIG